MTQDATEEPEAHDSDDALYESLYSPRTTPELEPEAADIYEHFYKRTQQ